MGVWCLYLTEKGKRIEGKRKKQEGRQIEKVDGVNTIKKNAEHDKTIKTTKISHHRLRHSTSNKVLLNPLTYRSDMMI